MSTKLFFAVTLALTPGLLFAETVVFDDVNVVPMDREVVLEHMTVVTEDGRITSVGRRGSTALPVEARRIDGRGLYLLPGLHEMHVHLRDRSALPLYLAYGFTTVRDMNGRLGDTLTWREEAQKGTLDGPRIVAAGVTLYVGAPEDAPYRVDTPESARRAVRELASRGYDLIKVYRVEREPFFALIDEARKLSIPVAGHHPDVVHDQDYKKPLDLSMDDVLDSGMVSLEHLDELITAGLRMKLDASALVPLAHEIRAHGVAVTTLLGQDFLVQQVRREGKAFLTEERKAEVSALFGEEHIQTLVEQIDFITNELPRDIADLGRAIPDFSLAMLRTFNESGVDLLIGTDSHSALVLAGRSGLDEMDLFVKAGLEPYDALRAATYNAAKVLRRLDDSGTVTVGKVADLVLVDENPLASLTTLRRPHGVMVRGQYYDRAHLDALLRNSRFDSP